jgi:hypothetical protein
MVWHLFSSCQGKTVFDTWHGVNLKFNFRRTVESATMEQWYEILQIASSI